MEKLWLWSLGCRDKLVLCKDKVDASPGGAEEVMTSRGDGLMVNTQWENVSALFVVGRSMLH